MNIHVCIADKEGENVFGNNKFKHVKGTTMKYLKSSGWFFHTLTLI